MSDEKRPLLLVGKDIKMELVLDLATVDMDVRRERDIQLLEWAVAGPLLKLGTSPTLDEISSNLGIGVEFLRSIADQLEMRKTIEKSGDGTYRLTDNGRRMIEKNRIVGDSRHRLLFIAYHPQSKEWLPGAEINPDIFEEVEIEGGVPDIVPEGSLVRHAKALGLMFKDDILYDHTVESVKAYRMYGLFNLILRKDGFLAIPQDRSMFGVDEESTGRLLRGITPALGRTLFDRVRGNDEWVDVEEMAPQRIPADLLAYVFNDLKTPLAKMILAHSKWMMTSEKEAVIELLRSMNPPKVIFYLGRQPLDANIGDALILWEPEMYTGGSVAATDGWALRRIMINDREVKVPVLGLQPTDSSFSEMVKVHLMTMLDQNPEDLGRSRALLLLDPREENLEKMASALMAIKDKKRREQAIGSTFATVQIDLPSLTLGPKAMDVLSQFFDELSMDDLIVTGNELAKLAPAVFGDALLRRLHSLGKDAEKSTKTIRLALERCKNDDVIREFEKALSYLDEVFKKELREGAEVSSLDQATEFIKKMPKMDPHEESELLRHLYRAVRKLSLDQDGLVKLLELYVKLGSRGVEIDPTDYKVVLRGYLGPHTLLIYDIKTKIKLEKLVKIKSGIPEFVLDEVLELPRVDRPPTDQLEMKIILANLKVMKQLAAKADDGYAIVQLDRMAVELAQIRNEVSWGLWLKCLAAAWKDHKQWLPSYDREGVVRIVRENKLDTKANLDELKALGVLDEVRRSENAEKRTTGEVDIFIDGSNIAYGSDIDKVPKASYLITAYEHLVKEYGYRKPQIIIGSGLRHSMPDYEELERFFKEESGKRGYSILFQAPAKESDDLFILKFAKKHDADILTNDLYRDHFEKNPELREMQTRLRRSMNIDGSFTLSKTDSGGSDSK